ncbi:hypothetical protein K0C01_01240 [Salinarchaeum sp. IM2453]|uniref:DUF5791 family protein n=1 Tax=Salinarchaeum sp. IM2453 TaxID=2862870 RepID=UPI001C83D9E1|nr:DUF5791 family protein [Salinarchaeum sp. IM2453]QZA88820.1 hypothetical protein K0C01_01240 [Salinarchaeum sp. IM2453]
MRGLLNQDRTDIPLGAAEDRYKSYIDAIRRIIDQHNRQKIQQETALDLPQVIRLQKRNPREITIYEAATVEALVEPLPPQELALQARETLVLGMAVSVTDVKSLFPEVEGVTSKEKLQSLLDGERSCSLTRYAEIEAAVARQRLA